LERRHIHMQCLKSFLLIKVLYNSQKTSGSQRTTPTPCHYPKRHNSAYTFSAGWKEQASPPTVLTNCINVWLRTAVLLTTRPSSGEWMQLQRSLVPLPLPSWTFSLYDAQAKPTVLLRTPPIPPTVSSRSYHQEDGTGASEPAPPDCSTAFSPILWGPWTWTWTQTTPSKIPKLTPTSWKHSKTLYKLRTRHFSHTAFVFM